MFRRKLIIRQRGAKRVIRPNETFTFARRFDHSGKTSDGRLSVYGEVWVQCVWDGKELRVLP